MAMPKIDTNQIRNLIHRFVKTNPQKKVEPELTSRTGLNVGRFNLVASEITWHEGRPVLQRCARQQIVQDKPLPDQIKNFFQESGFKSKHVSLSLKGQGVVLRFLAFPKMSRTDFASSIRYEAEKYLPFSLSEVTFDYQIINEAAGQANENGTTMPVILVAARKTDVERLIQTVQAAGLKPDLIDIDILACANAFQHAQPDIVKNNCVGLIDLGATDSSLGILNRETLVFSRDIAFGGSDLIEIIHRKLNIPHEKAFEFQSKLNLKEMDKINIVREGLARLFQEIKSSITYYYNQHQSETALETIYLSGGFSQLGVISKLLEEQLELPIKTWNPTDQMTFGEAVDKNSLHQLVPYLPVSIGLALRPR